MLIRYYGHSFFTIENEKGKLIAFDPFDESVGYRLPRLEPDIVLISHAHFDHSNASLFPDGTTIIAQAGSYIPVLDVKVTGIDTFHDDKQGILRGGNVCFKVETDNLTFLHLGDLGHALEDSHLKQIGRVDVLFLPVGGHYTIDAFWAKRIKEQISPRITIPMHYKTDVNESSPIQPVSAFTDYYSAIPKAMPILRITKNDITCVPQIVVMDITKEGRWCE